MSNVPASVTQALKEKWFKLNEERRAEPTLYLSDEGWKEIEEEN